MESPNGFVTWSDVVARVVESERATFYWMPSQLMQGWPGNAQRLEVSSFRAGQVHTQQYESATLYVEYIPRGARKRREAIQGPHPSLVIIEGWNHPDPPGGWVADGDSSRRGRWDVFAPEWRVEFDAFLTEYLRANSNVRILGDFRNTAAPNQNSNRILEDRSRNSEVLPQEDAYPSPEDGNIVDDEDQDQSAEFVMRAIRARRGQSAFRNTLRERYGDQCQISGCPILDVLEAAHIRPYRTEADNAPSNGLLLRADLHTLFDLDLLGIKPQDLTIHLHPRVARAYSFDQERLGANGHDLDQAALEYRWENFRDRLKKY